VYAPIPINTVLPVAIVGQRIIPSREVLNWIEHSPITRHGVQSSNCALSSASASLKVGAGGGPGTKSFAIVLCASALLSSVVVA
jgi:hypothetical protein